MVRPSEFLSVRSALAERKPSASGKTHLWTKVQRCGDWGGSAEVTLFPECRVPHLSFTKILGGPSPRLGSGQALRAFGFCEGWDFEGICQGPARKSSQSEELE